VLLDLRHEGLGAVDDPVQVDPDDPVIIPVVDLVEGGARKSDAGVVDEDVNVAEGLFDLFGGFVHPGAVGHVEDEGFGLDAHARNFTGRLVKRAHFHVRQGHIHLGPGEGPCDPQADP